MSGVYDVLASLGKGGVAWWSPRAFSLPPPVALEGQRDTLSEVNDRLRSAPQTKSCPNEPTVHTVNDALFAQFACIRSFSVRTCDYGSGGRGFESLPARNSNSAFQDHLGGRLPRFWVLARKAVHGDVMPKRDRCSGRRSVGIHRWGGRGCRSDRLPSGRFRSRLMIGGWRPPSQASSLARHAQSNPPSTPATTIGFRREGERRALNSTEVILRAVILSPATV